jgi:15-cis-phytoene synthase
MQHSRAITRKSASNLALAFVLLPRPKRDAMSALYAFCREVDDVADNEAIPPADRRAQLAAWRADVQRACENQPPQFPVNRDLQPVIRQFKLRFELFDDLLKGCEMDLDIQRHENFEALEKYCYHVASVVGLLSIEIFGYQNPACRDYAVHLGKALQLTNILRDVKTDAARGRIYLPQSALSEFRVSEDEILNSRYSGRFCALAASVARRARSFYRLAQDTLPAEDRKAMAAAELMGSVYWRLLRKLEGRRFNVFGPQPLALSKPHKLALVFQSWLRFTTGSTRPNYGAA